MTAAGGFEVDANGLPEISGTGPEQAEKVSGYLRALPRPARELLGEYGALDTAYASFLNAWLSAGRAGS